MLDHYRNLHTVDIFPDFIILMNKYVNLRLGFSGDGMLQRVCIQRMTCSLV